MPATDFHLFGMQMPGRTYNATESPNGFNGKRKDNEIYGEGNAYDYGFRIYDPRLGRFLSIDPLTRDYPWYTPYQFAGNNPIWAIDLDGLEEKKVNNNKPLSEPKLEQSDVSKVLEMAEQRAKVINGIIQKLDLPAKYKEEGTEEYNTAFNTVDNFVKGDFGGKSGADVAKDAFGLARDLDPLNKVDNKLKEKAGVAAVKGMKVFGFSAGKRLTGYLVASGGVGVIIKIADAVLTDNDAGKGSTKGEYIQNQVTNALSSFLKKESEPAEPEKDILSTRPEPASRDNTALPVATPK